MIHDSSQQQYLQQAGNNQAQVPRPSTELEAAINDLSQGVLALEHSLGEISRRVLPPVPEAVTGAPTPGRVTYSSSMVSLNERIKKLDEIAAELSIRI